MTSVEITLTNVNVMRKLKYGIFYRKILKLEDSGKIAQVLEKPGKKREG